MYGCPYMYIHGLSNVMFYRFINPENGKGTLRNHKN